MSSRQQTSASESPRRTLTDRISAVGAKINRALSSDTGRGRYDAETESMASTIVEGNERSTSRNRNNFHSSGRGGAGNIHRDPTPASPTTNGNNSNAEAQDFPWPRGRERAPVARLPPASTHTPQKAPTNRSTGRGGAGNFSHSPPAADPSYSLRDREILRAHAEADKVAFRSSGRGGIGNIVAPSQPDSAYAATNAARSRSRSIDPVRSPTNMPIRLNGAGGGYSPSPPRERERRNRDGDGVNVNNANGYGGGHGQAGNGT
ncbi:hypothetical protein B0H12DRAFT_1150797 [Mycena haematopus]|nr:hypothetical protein B0H12DRAFT_1151669 [Mycena haematopus]KAJ7222982.1 hypothetical protein B0H12DRAFT_1150797 [Mycena haematopus]